MQTTWLEAFRRAATQPLIVSLATVTVDGTPQVRSMVCRRIGDDGSLWFTSDSRSEKNRQLAANPKVSAVFYSHDLREQFRFTGIAETISQTTAAGPQTDDRVELWRQMRPESRAMFRWPPPGSPKVRDDAEFPGRDDEPLPPDTFHLIVLRPRVVEHLILSRHPHSRSRWTLKNADWQLQDLNP